MKSKLLSWIQCLLILMVGIGPGCQSSESNSQGEDFLGNVNQVSSGDTDDSKLLGFFEGKATPLEATYASLPQGSVKPLGWIRSMMLSDLKTGVVGALDDLFPGIKKDDLYRTARRGGLEDVPDMGDLVLTGEAWEKSIMWWNAETAGNWWDGFVRHAYLTEDETSIRQAEAIVENLIASQDEDGYIGIYKPSLRYQHKGSNGELWAQTTAFRTLLGYYSFTQDKRALDAVERAMVVTMKEYGADGKNPFKLENAFGGVTHGLMLTDVCEMLFDITHKSIYQEYATYLYKAFSTYNINRAFNDLRYPYLMDKDSLFTGHGVHTYEHVRTLLHALYVTGYPELQTAYSNALYKLDKAILPSGAGHGNEWLAGLEAEPTTTSSEYCTMLELRNSLASMFQKGGELKWADHAEKLTYNGMMGFRNKEGTAITYGKPDNCYILDGHHHEHGEKRKDVRYKYSPTHSDPAVCCVPNYSRNFPYFLDKMWMKKGDALVAAMYGPSVLNTQIKGKKIEVRQKTLYPFSDVIQFDIKVKEPINLDFMFRKPAWSDALEINGELTVSEGDFVKVSGKWEDGDVIRLKFHQHARIHEHSPNHHFIQRGPLVYALAIPHEEKVIKTYAGTDYTDYHCLPQSKNFERLRLHASSESAVLIDEIPTHASNPWHRSDFFLEVPLYDETKEEVRKEKFIPIGSTILRRVTFPKASE
ncbi:MAG: beta-L-arabinofuranosidase domain-containing protein [Bacteroidota bacterium]